MDGHGSAAGKAEVEVWVWGSEEEIFSLEAKVSDGGSGGLVGAWGVLAARDDVGGRPANGFAVSLEGLAVLGNENGLVLVEEGGAGVVPKSAAPRSSAGLCSCAKREPAFSSFGLAGAGLVDLYLLTSLKALILPGFRLQAFLLQLKKCSLRSSSGNWDGRSPFNCSSKDMKPLQALHFARPPDGEI